MKKFLILAIVILAALPALGQNECTSLGFYAWMKTVDQSGVLHETICIAQSGKLTFPFGPTLSSPVLTLPSFTSVSFTEVAAPAGSAGNDILWGDSTAHRVKMNNNNGGALTVAATSGDTFTSTTLTSPTINGTPTGTGVPTVTMKTGTGAGNYTSASTSLVRVDSTNLALAVTIPTGWKLTVAASGTITTSTAAVTGAIALADGTADNTGVLIVVPFLAPVAGGAVPFSVRWVVTGDGALHTINLQYSTTNGADSVLITNGSATQKPVMTFVLTPSN